MDKEDRNKSLIKKADSLTKFDPQKKKELIVRGLNEIENEKYVLHVNLDEYLYRLLFEEIESKYGNKIKLFYFKDGEPAFKFLKKNLDRVNLIISDILLPKLDGIKLLRMCKEIKPRLPFIFFTAYDYRDDFAVWASEAYIVKSSDLSELFSVISIFLFPNATTANDWITYANLLYERKVYIEAINLYKKALKIKPDDVNIHYKLGLTYLKIGQKTKALEEYRILKNIDSELAEKLFNLIYE